MFGSPETTTGGRALKFYSSVRLDVRRIETLKDGTDMVGNRTRVKVVKNKVAPPFKQAEFDIMYGKGISREGGLIDVGVEAGLVRKAGAWYTYEGDQLGQGKENARAFLKDNPDLANELEKKILEKLGVGPQVDARGASDAVRRADRCRCLLSALSTSEHWLGTSRPGSTPWTQPRRRRTAPSARGDRAPPTGDPVADGPDADPEAVARKILLDQLTGQARSRKELADKLASKNVPDEVATALLDRFEEVGLVDDEAFARSWVADRQRSKGLARGRWPRSCAARASTTRWPARRSTRSSRRTRRRRPGRWCARSCAPCPGRRHHRHPAAGRDAGPQGLPVGPGVRRGSRRAPRRWARMRG